MFVPYIHAFLLIYFNYSAA